MENKIRRQKKSANFAKTALTNAPKRETSLGICRNDFHWTLLKEGRGIQKKYYSYCNSDR